MEANKAQADYWASPARLKRIEHERALDTAMAGMLETLLDMAAIISTDRIIDIGCGTGASTIEAARRAPAGKVLGVDISDPLLARAAQPDHRATRPGARWLQFSAELSNDVGL